MGDKPEPFGKRFSDAVYSVLDTPVTVFREKFIEPNHSKPYPYYHRKMRRVPTIDTCFPDDRACIWEADQQVKRDHKVDGGIVNILRKRKEECIFWHGREEAKVKCKKAIDDYEENATNYYIKYGDLGVMLNAENVLMKQKHRLVWERRHGAVGTGMREAPLQPE